MVKSTKKDTNDAKMEDNAENREMKRLRKLAFSRKLISQTRSNPSRPLQPTKVILSNNGKDIVKKGQKKREAEVIRNDHLSQEKVSHLILHEGIRKHSLRGFF